MIVLGFCCCCWKFNIIAIIMKMGAKICVSHYKKTSIASQLTYQNSCMRKLSRESCFWYFKIFSGYYPTHQMSFNTMTSQMSQISTTQTQQQARKRLPIIDPDTGKDILEGVNDETVSQRDSVSILFSPLLIYRLLEIFY